MKKKKEKLSDNITDELLMQRCALKMATDPAFSLEQNSLVFVLKACSMMMVQIFDRLEDGALPLLAFREGGRYTQLMKNARTANERLIDILLKAEESQDKTGKGMYYEELFNNADSMIDVFRAIIEYMSASDDNWRFTELMRKMDELIPLSLREDREQMMLEELKASKDFDYDQCVEKLKVVEELIKQRNEKRASRNNT